MSFLSFFGSSFTTTHIITQIYRSPDFNNFMKNINDKDTPVEVLETFIRNYIFKQSDLVCEFNSRIILILKSPMTMYI